MEPMWFYMDGQIRRGPLSTQDLIAALSTTAEPGRTHVWREGLADWERAGALPELSSKLPPQIEPDHDAPSSVSPDEEEELDVAVRYRRLVLLVGVQLLKRETVGVLEGETKGVHITSTFDLHRPACAEAI
jgi:GYF domain 2